MSLDDMLLAEAEQARDRMEAAQDEVESARAEYHRAIRRLHAAGGTLREIAEALALSHQRVHQVVESGSMIDPSPTPKDDLIRCSFCHVDQKHTKKLIAGPGVYICEVCMASAATSGAGRVEKDARGVTVPIPSGSKAQCSFCGKKRAKVEWMVAGPGDVTRICNECIKLCSDIVAKDR